MTQCVEVYCEGYHDRDYLAGWLESRGWKDPGRRADGSRHPVKHPRTGAEIKGGRFGFYWNDDAVFLELVKCDGKPRVLPAVEARLRELPTKPVECVAVITDLDTDPDASRFQRSLEAMCKRVSSACTINGDNVISFPSVDTKVLGICWHVAGESRVGVPSKNTLERIVCSALSRAYPTRAQAVEAWLNSRPDPPANSPKAFSWSYMAGWWPELGCNRFLRQLWTEPDAKTHLDDLMEKCGAASVLAMIEAAGS